MNSLLPTDEAGKNAEALLQREKLFSDTIITSIPGVLYLYNEEGRFLRWNNSFETVSGYSAEEVARMHPLDFFDADQKQLVKEKIAEVFAEGESSVESEFLTKDGKRVPYFFTGRRVTFDGATCLVGLGVDITERRQASIDLHESERKYRELVEHANSIILRWTRDGRITFLNEYGLKFFDFTAEQIIGRHVVGTIVPALESTNRDLRPLMDNILENPEAYTQNINENMRRNGERVWIAWTNKTVLDEHGEITEVLSIGTDITGRRRAEAQIAEQAAFLDKARDAIIARTLDGKVLFWNQGAEAVYGWKSAEVLGRNIGELIYTDQNAFREINSRVLVDGEWSGELRHFTKDRKEIIIDLAVGTLTGLCEKDAWRIVFDKGKRIAALGRRIDHLLDGRAFFQKHHIDFVSHRAGVTKKERVMSRRDRLRISERIVRSDNGIGVEVGSWHSRGIHVLRRGCDSTNMDP